MGAARSREPAQGGAIAALLEHAGDRASCRISVERLGERRRAVDTGGPRVPDDRLTRRRSELLSSTRDPRRRRHRHSRPRSRRRWKHRARRVHRRRARAGYDANKIFIENGRDHGDELALCCERCVADGSPALPQIRPRMRISPDVMEKLVSLCKRRGFIFQSSEIYGGTGSVWDYGPLGVELKRNLKERWWHAMVRSRDDIEGLDAAILMHPRVWEASGHVGGFVDPLVDCKTCKGRFRADKLEDAQCLKKPSRQPGEYERVPAHRAAPVQPDVQDVHGPVEDTARRDLPAPGDGAGHLRQLPQRAAGHAPEGSVRHRADRQGVPQRDHAGELHLPHARVRADGDAVLRRARARTWSGSSTGRPSAWSGTARSASTSGVCSSTSTKPDELAHYARAAFDIEFDFGGTLGFQEIEGMHNRGDFDLGKHQEYSGKKLEYFDQPNNKRFVPYRHRDVVWAESHDARRARERVSRGERSRANRKGAWCCGCIPRSRRSRPASFRS